MLSSYFSHQKVHKQCGQPSIRHTEKVASSQEKLDENEKAPSLEGKQGHHSGNGNKWSPPPDTEMLQFLAVLDRSKSFSLQIANRLGLKIIFWIF